VSRAADALARLAEPSPRQASGTPPKATARFPEGDHQMTTSRPGPGASGTTGSAGAAGVAGAHTPGAAR
jgi:hypothetical protein